jgi:hypothetical protein
VCRLRHAIYTHTHQAPGLPLQLLSAPTAVGEQGEGGGGQGKHTLAEGCARVVLGAELLHEEQGQSESESESESETHARTHARTATGMPLLAAAVECNNLYKLFIYSVYICI